MYGHSHYTEGGARNFRLGPFVPGPIRSCDTSCFGTKGQWSLYRPEDEGRRPEGPDTYGRSHYADRGAYNPPQGPSARRPSASSRLGGPAQSEPGPSEVAGRQAPARPPRSPYGGDSLLSELRKAAAQRLKLEKEGGERGMSGNRQVGTMICFEVLTLDFLGQYCEVWWSGIVRGFGD